VKNIRTTSLLLVGLLFLPACAGSTSDTQSGAYPELSPHFVRIENDGSLDADVYLVAGNETRHLDLVASFQEKTVRIPPVVVPGMEIRILVDPIGSPEAYLSDPMEYSGTDDYQLRIDNDLELTSFYPSVLTAGVGK
jgi:hypothetical protein